MYLGYDGPTNQLTVTTSGSVIASNVYVGYNSASVGNQITITNGSLSVVNALDLRGGTLTFNGGTVAVDQLMLTNFAGSRMTFTSGTLTSGGTTVSNGLEFVVGDGIHAATFYLNGSMNPEDLIGHFRELLKLGRCHLLSRSDARCRTGHRTAQDRD